MVSDGCGLSAPARHRRPPMIRTIPLGKLVPSPRNVRRRIDEQADLELKADIAARGLLQNLVVTQAKIGEEAYLAAGGRIECDLFADDGASRWLDVALLE